MRNYGLCKTSFQEEEYLIRNINRRDHRYAFTKLRLSAHKLEIEMGRYAPIKNRKDPKNRICRFCKNGCEDEEHFMVICPLYNKLRKDLYNEIHAKYNFFTSYNNK